MQALEMFGRDGTWHTKIFANKVKDIEIWEVDKKWENNLKQNFPFSKIRILDSVKMLKNMKEDLKFDLLLIDNPMNVFGPISNHKNDYCEHFDVIKDIKKLSKKEVLVIFNVNRRPFDYNKYPEWKKRRQEFYGNIDTSNMSLEFLNEFYTKLFLNLDFVVKFYINVVRVFYQKEDMTYYFAYYLKNNKK